MAWRTVEIAQSRTMSAVSQGTIHDQPVIRPAMISTTATPPKMLAGTMKALLPDIVALLPPKMHIEKPAMPSSNVAPRVSLTIGIAQPAT